MKINIDSTELTPAFELYPLKHSFPLRLRLAGPTVLFGIIRRIKGLRTRGRLTDGVTLVRDISTVQAIATEPKVTESLPWLDPANADDRILAAFIEVMRGQPGRASYLITRDINLQNKAEFAGLPFLEPPEVVAERAPNNCA